MPSEDIFPSPWNSFMLKYHCFRSAQILLGWIMRQMENKKGGASSECCILGGIDALCWFPASTYFSHLRALSPPSCGDARAREVPGVNYRWRHTRLSGPPPHLLDKLLGTAQPSWAWHVLRSEPAWGKLQGVGLRNMQNSTWSIGHLPERAPKASAVWVFSRRKGCKEFLIPVSLYLYPKLTKAASNHQLDIDWPWFIALCCW